MSPLHRILEICSPHGRAERLIDERGDAARDGGALEPTDAAWLSAHLDACERCRGFEAERAALHRSLALAKPARAPDAFAGRMLLAARSKQTGRAAELEATARAPIFPRAFAFAGAAAALGGFVILAAVVRPASESGETAVQAIERSGAGIGASKVDDAHFVVRAPGVGAAAIRARVTALIETHDGRYEVDERAVMARIPRAKLLKLLEDLARHGSYKVSKREGREISVDEGTIHLRFELE